MDNKEFNIDNCKCIHCKHCINVCPVKLLETSHHKNMTLFKENAAADCILCGHCSSACPVNAISIPDINIDDNSNLQANVDISFDKLSIFLKSRRSIRTYLNKSVKKENIYIFTHGENDRPIFGLIKGDFNAIIMEIR